MTVPGVVKAASVLLDYMRPVYRSVTSSKNYSTVPPSPARPLHLPARAQYFLLLLFLGLPVPDGGDLGMLNVDPGVPSLNAGPLDPFHHIALVPFKQKKMSFHHPFKK